MKDIFTGKLVRLSAYDVEEMTRTSSRWIQNSEYQRMISSSPFPMRSWNAVSKELEEEVGELSPAPYFFSIRTLAEDRLIGDLNLDVINWSGRDAFVGLGIGETEYWGKGYGTDVMNVLLRFAFSEINLRRVTLTVFEAFPTGIGAAVYLSEYATDNRLNRLLQAR